jgi:hypothetical protein
MSEVINITVSAKVKNGPGISFSNFLNIDAYDKLDDSSDPETLVFTNDLAEDVNIQILVGRNVTT